ncbi:hypothetical protein [Morganella morganii]|uniref:hypothetical protein n=1 Tax=Morganella morganii TaxID=582 RepID=UPI0034D5D23A
MQNLYTLIIISDEGLQKEITIPSGRYGINNAVNHDNNLINLNITDTSLLPEQTEVELHDDHYRVSFKTYNGELITQEISYNSPFICQGKCLFAIKNQSDEWCKNIMLPENKVRHPARRYLLPIMILLLFLPVTGLMFFQYSDNRIRNPDNIDSINIIKKYIESNNYIINGNNILILYTDEHIIKIIRDKLPGYHIHRINKSKLKINNNDIILTPDFYHRKEIIYIRQDNNKTPLTLLAIPDTFRENITIRYFSFDDITRLINNRFSHLPIRYSVKKSHNSIIIHGEKRRDKETDNIIKDINTTISSAPENTLVQYREIPYRDTPPGVYGSINYIHLSDNHTKFTSDDK